MSAGHVTLGAEIRAARDACGISLRELARRADLAPSTLSLAERGGPCIGDAALERICDALAANRPTRERWAARCGEGRCVMGYDFSIGEAKLYAPSAEDIDREYDRAELRVMVDPLRKDGDGALLSGGYSWFLGWTERVGLWDLFFTTREGYASRGYHRGDGLMPEHPGCARLTPKHLERFRAALATAEARDPGSDDAAIARWFVKWTEHALAECRVPALYNR